MANTQNDSQVSFANSDFARDLGDLARSKGNLTEAAARYRQADGLFEQGLEACSRCGNAGHPEAACWTNDGAEGDR